MSDAMQRYMTERYDLREQSNLEGITMGPEGFIYQEPADVTPEEEARLTPDPEAPATSEEGPGFFDVLKDLAVNVGDSPNMAIRGGLNALTEIAASARLIDDEQADSFRKMLKASGKIAESEGVNPMVRTMGEGIAQFGVGMVGPFKAMRAMGVARPYAAVISEALSGAFAFNPDDPNLGQFINSFEGRPQWLGAIADFIETDPNDGEAVNRMRNAIQDFVPAAVVETIVGAVSKAKNMDPDALVKAGQEAEQRLASQMRGTTLSANPVGAAGDMLVAGAGKVAGKMQGDEVAPVFYSAVLNAVDALPMDKGGAAQMRAMIAKGEGVKAEEMAWIGLDDFLKGKKSVTKQEVRDYVEANQVRIEEVTKKISGDGRGGVRIDDELEDGMEYVDPLDRDEMLSDGIANKYSLGAYDEEGIVERVEIFENIDLKDPVMTGRFYDQFKLIVDNDERFQKPDFSGLRDDVAGVLEDFANDPEKHFTDVRDLFEMFGQGDQFYGAIDGLGNYEILSESGSVIGTARHLIDATHQARMYLKTRFEIDSGANPAKFGPDEYPYLSLPGGENYREVLLRLPEKKLSAKDENALSMEMFGKDIEELSYSELNQLTAKRDGRLFEKSHFDESNVLAHLRLTDRTGPDGERILFVEEMQSDWHAKGRDDGYIKPLPEMDEAMNKRYQDLMAAMQDDYPIFSPPKIKIVRDTDVDGKETFKLIDADIPRNQLFSYATRDLAEKAMERSYKEYPLEDRIKDRERLRALHDEFKPYLQPGKRVPDAPLKKTWHEMTLRRVARMAAEEGYDRIAWTPGKMQIDRYEDSLRQNVDEITYEPDGDGGFNMAANKNGKSVYDTEGMTIEEVEKVFGKDIAQKVQDDVGAKFDDKPLRPDLRLLTGDNLSIGGKFFKDLYDKKIKQYASKWGKKFGSKVGVTDIDVGGGDSDFAFDTEQVWSMPVTKKMKDSVLRKGVPFFGAAGATALVGAGSENEN